jgi:hypothetical protein
MDLFLLSGLLKVNGGNVAGCVGAGDFASRAFGGC